MDPATWSFGADPGGVRDARRAAQRCARDAGFSDEAVWAVALAVTEAATNAALHAFVEPRGGRGARGDEPRRFWLSVEQVPDGDLLVTVADNGTGMRARTDSPGLGYGLRLIAESAADVRYAPAVQGGLAVWMRFPPAS